MGFYPSMGSIEHASLLLEAYTNLLESNDLIKVITSTKDVVKINRNLLLFHSPFLRDILSLSSCSSSPILLLPSVSSSTLSNLHHLLTQGETISGTSVTIIDAAKILGIRIKEFELVPEQVCLLPTSTNELSKGSIEKQNQSNYEPNNIPNNDSNMSSMPNYHEDGENLNSAKLTGDRSTKRVTLHSKRIPAPSTPSHN